MRREDRMIEVVNYLWPAGVGVHPPSARMPYWRTGAGRRLHYRDVVLGQDADRQQPADLRAKPDRGAERQGADRREDDERGRLEIDPGSARSEGAR